VLLIDLFAGRLGWSKGFLARGWKVRAYDLRLPDMEIPEGVEYILQDILTLTAEDLRDADFVTCSSPCEQFSVHCMKHFHPNPKPPVMGIKLFEHSRAICEASGKPYVMENVRCAQKFVGPSVNHCGPFHLWGNAVPGDYAT
jgi:site-specific DNA-cytosine methylase